MVHLIIAYGGALSVALPIDLPPLFIFPRFFLRQRTTTIPHNCARPVNLIMPSANLTIEPGPDVSLTLAIFDAGLRVGR